MRKGIKVLTVTCLLAVSISMTALAGQWQQNSNGWWYDNGDGTWPDGTWQWIDGNADGIAESYYFDENGYMAADTTVEGFQVNANGAWTDGNEVVQTKSSFNQGSVSIPTGYTDGISNAALEMLTASREELVAKYGAETAESYRGYAIIRYANSPFTLKISYGFEPEDNADLFISGRDYMAQDREIRVYGPSYEMIEGITENNDSLENVAKALKPYNILNIKGDTAFYSDNYFIVYQGSSISICFTESYIKKNFRPNY